MDKMSRPVWQLLMLTSDSTKSIDLTCEECFSLLEFDAHVLTTGAVSDEFRPFVSHHLELCPECQTKFSSWLDKLAGYAEK
jgi:hypothetical protein